MSFTNFLQNIATIFTNIFSWLVNISSALFSNFVFKIIFFMVLIAFLTSIIIKLYNKVNKNDDFIDDTDDLQLIDEDYWEEEDFEEGDFDD